MKKRLIALALAAAVIISMIGCSSSGGENGGKSDIQEQEADSTESSGEETDSQETDSQKADDIADGKADDIADSIEKTDAGEKSENGELTMLVLNGLLSNEHEQGIEFQKLIAKYEEEHGVTINLQAAAASDIKQSFQTAALAGAGADIVMADNSGHAIDMAAMGLLYPLTELTTEEELLAEYQPGPLNSGKFRGEYYSVPWYMDCCGFYYNKTHLKDAGLEVPTTWEELSNALTVLKSKGYGGIITYDSAYAFYSFFYQNGCPVIDTSGDIPKVVIDNEEGKEAWNYICDIIGNGGMVESFKEANNWSKVYESFANGEATFLLGGDWCANAIDELAPDLDYGITVMVEGKTQATVLGGWTWNINANCKNPELAFDLIQYINSENGDAVLFAEGKSSARKDFDYAKTLEGKEKLEVLTQQFPYTMPRPAIINEQAIDELITNAIMTVVYGESAADEALASLAEKINENIMQNYQ